MLVKVKPIIFTCTSFYLPGYRGGGPIRSIANMVSRLSDEYEFLVVTTDRDLHDQHPFQNVKVDAWNQIGRAKVFYASPSMRTLWGITRLLRETKYDLLYLNSFFDRTFTLQPLVARWLRLVPEKPTIVAPRGEFSEGAFKLKFWKKSPFTKVASRMGLYAGVTWHASTELEKTDISRMLTHDARNIAIAGNVTIAPDLLFCNGASSPVSVTETVRDPSCLNACFLSRLTPKKNLDFALRVLARVSVPVKFTIYGPTEEPSYWHLCEELIEQLPNNIKVTYAGSVPNDEVLGKLRNHDLLFLPTRGENFGHVFLEAWSAGLAVLVSDQTPWRDLKNQRLGWDLSLDAPDEFVRALELAAKFDDVQWGQIRRCCEQFAAEQAKGTDAVKLNVRLFSDALSGTVGKPPN